METPIGKRYELMQELARLERLAGLDAGEPPRRSAFWNTVAGDALLPEETYRCALRIRAVSAQIEQMLGREADSRTEEAGSERAAQAARQEAEELEIRLAAALDENAALGSRGKVQEERLKKAVKALVAYRDGLLLRLSMAEQEHNAAMETVFRSLCKESLNLLEQMDVSLMLPLGKFDAALHVAVDTEPTADRAMHDFIARVYRPGYMLGAEVLRVQEVIVYRYTED